MIIEFAAQITSSQQRLFAYICSLLDNSAAAWDVLQQTNLVLWQKQAEFRPGTNFNAWSFTVARFQVMAFLRDRKRDPLQLMEPVLCELMAEDAATEAAEFDHRLAALQKCREQLPERSRRLVELYYERGLSLQQVAEHVSMGAEAVKQALFRVRRLLQDCIEGQTITPDSP